MSQMWVRESCSSTFAGRYQIIEELGRGGMGEVYQVLDKEADAKLKAREHYEKFLDLWGDAAPGSPEVQEAEQRLAKLRMP